MAAKLGLDAPDPTAVQDLLALLHAQRSTSRSSSGRCRRTCGELSAILFARAATRSTRGLRGGRPCCPRTGHAVAAAMDRVNPVYIPRNHLVEEALTAATDGDIAPLRRLVDVLARPFDERPGLERYAEPAPAAAAPRHLLRHLNGTWTLMYTLLARTWPGR